MIRSAQQNTCDRMYPYSVQEVCTCYWPHTGAISVDDINVELIGSNSTTYFTTRIMKITDNKVRILII